MKRNFIKYCCVACIFLSFAGCKKDNPYNFYCKINGSDYKSNIVPGNTTSAIHTDSLQSGEWCVLSINALDPFFQQAALSITLQKRINYLGDYSLLTGMYSDTSSVPCDTAGCLFGSMTYTPDYISVGTVNALSAQINLTSVDTVHKTISGTFSAAFPNNVIVTAGTLNKVGYIIQK